MSLKAFIQRLFSKSKLEKELEKIPATTSASLGLEEPPAYDLKAQIEAYRSWVFSAVNKIAQPVADIDLRLYRKHGDRVEEVKQHASLDLLHKVNNSMTFYDLVELYEIYMLLTGEAFWWLIRDKKGNIVEIYPWLRPDRMFVVPSKEKFIEGYIYSVPGTNERIPFDAKDIIHFKKVNPLNPYRGLSPVKAAEYAIATDLEASKYNWRFFKNDAKPSAILKVEGTLTDEQFQRLKERWEAEHRGENQHKIAILSGGMSYEPIAVSQRDMEFLAQRKFSRDEILSIFRVPRLITEETTRASAEASYYQFMRDTILPEMKKFCNYLNEFFLPNYGDDELFFDFINDVPSDTSAKVLYYKAGIEAGFLTPNEIRQWENLPAIEGGDNIFVPFNLQPIGHASGKKYLTSQKFKMLPRKRTLKEKIKPIISKSLLSKKSKIIQSKEQKVNDKLNNKFEEYGQKIWRMKIQKTDIAERLFANLLISEFERQKKQIIASLKAHSLYFAFNVDSEEKQFREKFKEFLFEVMKEHYHLALREIPPSFKSFKLKKTKTFNIDKDMLSWLDKYGLKFCKTVNEETKERIKEELKKSIEEKETLVEARQRIDRLVEQGFKIQRTKTIARTEIQRAANEARYQAFVRNDAVKALKFYAALDERVCDECRALNGQEVDIGEPFVWIDENGDEKVTKNADRHINCRCVLVPVFKTPEELFEEREEEEEKRLEELDRIKKEYASEVEKLKALRNKITNLID